jgi:hypothetical protein
MDPSLDRSNPYSNAWMYSEEALKATIDFIGETNIYKDTDDYSRTVQEFV